MGIGSRDDANLQAALKNTRLEWESGHVKLFHSPASTLGTPLYQFAVGNTATAPAAGSATYDRGCLYVCRTGTTNGGVLFVNLGTGTSSAFAAVGV